MPFSINDANYINAQMAGYQMCDRDDANDVCYYGYQNTQGGWYILRDDTSASPRTSRFAKGDSDYSTNFTNRASLAYDYYATVFK